MIEIYHLKKISICCATLLAIFPNIELLALSKSDLKCPLQSIGRNIQIPMYAIYKNENVIFKICNSIHIDLKFLTTKYFHEFKFF